MTLTPQKVHGIHYTPRDLAAFLAEQIVQRVSWEDRDIVVLDPACGDGELLSALVQATPADVRSRLVLLGYDTDGEAALEASRALSTLEVRSVEVKTRDFLSLAAVEPVARGGLFPQETPGRSLEVDLIISNPPYVRTQVLGASQAQRLARRFGLTGRVDLYHAFAMGMLNVLKPGGILGLLTSNRFLLTKAGASMRKLLRERIELLAVFDLGDTKLFDAAVLPAILVGRHRGTGRSGACDFTRVYQTHVPAADSEGIPSCHSILEALREGREGIVRVPGGACRIEKGRVAASPDDSKPWFLASGTVDQWLTQVARKTRYAFGDVAEIRVGIKTTADDVFIRDDWDSLDPDRRPEERLLRPLLTHHVARRWNLPASESVIGKRVLYPHEIRCGKRCPIRLSDYPRARRYLESHRERLEKRTYVIEAGRKWYEIWVPQDPSEWTRAKIVCPDISAKPCFFLDGDGAVVNGDCYWLTLRPWFGQKWLLLLLAVANSAFMETFYDTRFHNKLYAGRRRFITQYIKDFPLPDIESPAAERILSRTEALLKTVDQRERSHRESQIDGDVWRAFGLPGDSER